jgi:type IV secretory pathway TrbD component/type IV secretory pathway VirB2 component (pilin)
MTRSFFHINRRIVLAAFIGAQMLVSGPAWAAGSNMPWEQPLNQILQSVQGPVAKILAVIIIIMTGLTLAFGDTSGGFRRLIQIVFGLSIAFAASSFFLSFFSFGGGGAGVMEDNLPSSDSAVAGFTVPVHRALTEPILLGGAPRAVAILNGTLAAALGLGLRLWLAGLLLGIIGQAAAVWAAKRDPQFVDVVRRHLRISSYLGV